MIEAKNLKKIYKTKKVTVNALDGVSLRLPDKGMVFILGKSGSGKSTLLNVLGGLDSFDEGEIIIKGTSSKSFKQRHYDSYRNTYIGFIFQEYNVLEELTVGANVALAIELQGRRATDKEINEILAEVDLEGYGARKPNELSGGQKQRVAIARALVKHPEIIMADEPTGALDSVTGRQVFETLKKLSRDKLVLIVSHDREFSEQYADRIIELADGKIISDVEREVSEQDIAIEELDEPLTFLDGEISVKAGYTITEEDRLLINEYLSKKDTDTVIKVKRTRKANAYVFKPTDESKIQIDKKGDFKLIKSRLSIKNAFKLGSGALKYKKIRLVFTIFLSFIAFTLFGLADTIAAYDSVRTATSSIYDTGVPYATYVKVSRWGEGEDAYWTSSGTYLKDEDLDVIAEKTGYNVIGVYRRDESFSLSSYFDTGRLADKNADAIYTDDFSGIAKIDQALLDINGFAMLEGSRLPEGDKNEIVITKYIYDYFKICGYVNNGEKADITAPTDLIGKKVSFGVRHNGSEEFEIVGIVDTEFDLTPYEPLADPNVSFNLNMLEMMTLQSELDSAQNASFACIGFVSEQVLRDVVSSFDSSYESLSSFGNFNYYFVKDDNIAHDWEIYGDDGTNVISSGRFDKIGSLSDHRDRVVWIGDPIENLADNQIIINVDSIGYAFGGAFQYPDGFFDLSRLPDIELSLHDMCINQGYIMTISVENILRNPKYFCALHYAEENKNGDPVVNNKVREYYGLSFEAFDSTFKSRAEIYHTFATLAEAGYCDDLIDEQYYNSYISLIASSVGFTNLLVPKSVAQKFVASYEYNGETYYNHYNRDEIFIYPTLLSNAEQLISSRFAWENVEEAKAFYQDYYNRSDEQMQGESIENIISTYAAAVVGRLDMDIPKSERYNEFYTEVMVHLVREIIPENKIVISAYSYNYPWNDLIKNAEIVGIVPSANTNGYEVGIASDNVINQLLGVNRGGVYAYAVGHMPAERDAINEIVKFSKHYTNDANNTKYDLVNNVTSQLSMVDELLAVLGKVFLYVGVGFALFASLMLSNFISTSITYKKQDIGILRAIGSRSSDVFRIFFAESFIIAMINFVLAVAGTLAVTIVLNYVIRNEAGLLITFLNFGVRQVAVLLGVSLLVAVLATFFPVRKIARMKPIDAIKNRK